jgi:NAD(P)-dependent dehydrogenase (short-subunit alcohol dehydrogenase family)
MHGKKLALATGGRFRTWAAAVRFIASPLSDFMTGSTFRIDGAANPAI